MRSIFVFVFVFVYALRIFPKQLNIFSMAKGKRTCKILKEIRRQIAEANDIEYVTEECQYKGDCLGTCPKCEAEVRYLEQQLHQRHLLGKAAMIAGVSVGMLTLSSCNGTGQRLQGDVPNIQEVDSCKNDSLDEIQLEGDVYAPDSLDPEKKAQ